MAGQTPYQDIAKTSQTKFKIVFLGDMSVGKTCIINQFMYGTFDSSHQPTIGIDFLSKTMYMDDQTVRLQLWDTAGQERFRSLIPSYIRDSSAAVVVYDITNRQSFLSIDKWVEDVRAERGTQVVIMLSGNKSDLTDKRVVTAEEGERKAQELNAKHLDVSAKEGHNIKQLFLALSQELPGMKDIQLAKSAEFGGSDTVKLSSETQKSSAKSGCKC